MKWNCHEVSHEVNERRMNAVQSFVTMASSTVLRESIDFKRFRSQVPMQKVAIGGDEVWRYFAFGPPVKPVPAPPVLIFLPSISGTASCFYLQLLALAPRGYHVI